MAGGGRGQAASWIIANQLPEYLDEVNRAGPPSCAGFAIK